MACRRPDLEVAGNLADEEAAWKPEKPEFVGASSPPPSPQRPTPLRSCGLRLCSFLLGAASVAMLLGYQGSYAHLVLERGLASEAMREPQPQDAPRDLPKASPPEVGAKTAAASQSLQQLLRSGPRRPPEPRKPAEGQGQQQPPPAAVGLSFEQWVAVANSSERQSAVNALVPYVELEHPVPLLPCRDVPPPVSLESDEDCARVAPDVFTGLRVEGPAFLVDVSVFGFDLDAMEVKLHELNSTVDLFCIIESTFSHHGDRKPLLWARNKAKPRFAMFQHRVIHVIVNETEAADALTGDNIWRFEATQEGVGLRKLRQHLSQMQIPARRKIVLNFGDADELATPQNLHLVKHCNPSTYPLGHGVWMPLGRFDRAFQTDFPVAPDMPYTFANPSSWDVADPAVKRFAGAAKFLVGGWHLTNYVYPPFALLKGISCTEASYDGFSPPPAMREPGGLRKWFEGESAMTNNEWTRQWLERTVPVGTLKLQEPYKTRPELLEPPSVMRCNKERYEAWYGIYDRRLSLPLLGDGARSSE